MNDEKDLLGADAAAVVTAGSIAPAQLTHAAALRHVLDVATFHTCDLDHFATAMNVVKGLESGWLLLVSRANAEAALNDARVWGQWYEHKGANSSEAHALRTRARVMIGLEVGYHADQPLSETSPSTQSEAQKSSSHISSLRSLRSEQVHAWIARSKRTTYGDKGLRLQMEEAQELLTELLDLALARETTIDEPRLNTPVVDTAALQAHIRNQSVCMTCDGCGWCEGSPAFKCPECNGVGHLARETTLSIALQVECTCREIERCDRCQALDALQKEARETISLVQQNEEEDLSRSDQSGNSDRLTHAATTEADSDQQKCENCGTPIMVVFTTADDVDLCEECYREVPS